MKSSDIFMNNFFRHIYVEKKIYEYEITQNIIKKFKNSGIILIENYKDIFNRKNQNYNFQKKSPDLILAFKNENYIYKGSPNCQNMGFEEYYYITQTYNCIYECDYCFLQGMLDSGNILIFVNTEDFFNSVKNIDNKPEKLVSISYESDMLSVNGIYPLAEKWLDFSETLNNIKIEIRTKSLNTSYLKKGLNKNIILSWSVLPDEIIKKYEKRTPELSKRIDAVNRAAEYGYKINLAIEPIIIIKNFENIYSDFIKYIFKNIKAEFINSVSYGFYRIPSEYIKKIKRISQSELTFYNYILENNNYTYGRKITNEKGNFIQKEIKKYYKGDIYSL